MDVVSHGDSDVRRVRSPLSLVESGAGVVIFELITSLVHPLSVGTKETGEDKTSCVTHLSVPHQTKTKFFQKLHLKISPLRHSKTTYLGLECDTV